MNQSRLSGPWPSLSMGLLLLQVWIDNLGRMEVEALGHTVDPYSGAQMGLGIMGTYNFNYLTLFSFN